MSAPIIVQIVPDTFGPALTSSNVTEGGVFRTEVSRTVDAQRSPKMSTPVLSVRRCNSLMPETTSFSPQNIQFHKGSPHTGSADLRDTGSCRQLHAAHRSHTGEGRDRQCDGHRNSRYPLHDQTIFQWEWGPQPRVANWNIPANWSTGIVPVATDDVFIGCDFPAR